MSKISATMKQTQFTIYKTPYRKQMSKSPGDLIHLKAPESCQNIIFPHFVKNLINFKHQSNITLPCLNREKFCFHILRQMHKTRKFCHFDAIQSLLQSW